MKKNIDPRIPEYSVYKKINDEFVFFKKYIGKTHSEIYMHLFLYDLEVPAKGRSSSFGVDSFQVEEDDDWIYLDVSWTDTGGILRVMTYGRTIYRISK